MNAHGGFPAVLGGLDGRIVVSGDWALHCGRAQRSGAAPGGKLYRGPDIGPSELCGSGSGSVRICSATVGQRNGALVYGGGNGSGSAGVAGHSGTGITARNASAVGGTCYAFAVGGEKGVESREGMALPECTWNRTKSEGAQTVKKEKKTEKNVAKSKKDII